VTRVLGVHGIGNHRYFRDAARSAEAATAAIAADWSGWLGKDVEVAYYAHHLHRGTPQGDDPATLEDGAQDLLVSWVEALQPVPAIAQGPRTARARQAADWLTRRFGPAARLFALAFCREVHTYLAHPDGPRRAAARDEVAAAVEAHRPRVIVAHSLGTVVAYEALWSRPDLNVDLLLTLGSPLAMPGVVRDRLRPAEQARPPGVRRWVNLADVGDLVAIPRGGLGAHFDGVVDHPDVAIADWDFHTVRSYLRCPEVAAAIGG
jgi:hypothetical protein